MRAPLFALALLVSAPLVAQEAPAPLTELERLRVENLQLRGQLLQIQLEAFQADRAKLARDLEAVRPGWIWDTTTGTFSKKPAK